MNLNRLLSAAVALLSLVSPLRAQNESLASIINNADVRAVPARRPSIIYIQCHGLGYGDLSCYGQTNYFTPNLDRLAAGGIRFTDFRPEGTNFTDALAALMSGKKTGGSKTQTIAARLQAAGYNTGLIGEWTPGSEPWRQGFDEFAGFLDETDARNYYADHIRRFAPRGWVTESNTVEDFNGSSFIYENSAGKRGKYIPEVLVNAACNFLKIHQPDSFNAYKPLFLLVNLPAPRSATAGADDFTVPSDAPYSGEKWPPAARNRAALITRLDGGIGRVLEKLKELTMTNNVVIFFSSSAAPEPFADAKLNFLNPCGTFTPRKDAPAPLPMIVWSPDLIPARPASPFPWSSADFAPTALELAYVPAVKGLDGKSIVPVLNGKSGGENRPPAPR